MHAALLLSLMACNLFKGCGELDIPEPVNTDDDSDQQDTSPEDDTAVDTGPPPPCAFPEEEPNNSVDDAQPIDMEAWACGVLDEAGDFDVFEFSNVEDGWMEVWVRGADIGSASDLQVVLSDADNDYVAKATRQMYSSDPLLVVPVPADTVWNVVILDQYLTYSDQHIWEMITSMTKAPLDWTTTEVEPNDTAETGQPIEGGDHVYGFINKDNDNDYYLIEVPGGGKTTITATTMAWKHGSPVNTSMILRDPAGEEVEHAYGGATSGDRDAYFDTTVTDPGTWSLQVVAQDNIGGPLYWYILNVELDTEYDDTGAAAD